MLANPPHQPQLDPLALYSKSLHDYTLQLWTESRRLAEEKVRAKAAKKQEEDARMGARKDGPAS
ncbi:hypothetical protein EWM64_g2647 [Hericium alpestre]|uniref:Uncharacterized protein n=1 Tax=Hericium alpestre TaxID=135208 RepID=A0A4Z0A4W5_9AGAM|nr:hypothetical protein EWM64_g2647 [Hericium alpestre]